MNVTITSVEQAGTVVRYERNGEAGSFTLDPNARTEGAHLIRTGRQVNVVFVRGSRQVAYITDVETRARLSPVDYLKGLFG
jgi:hypothetical protein